MTFSIVHDPAEGFEMQAPYVLAIVKSTEGPQLTGQVVDVLPRDVTIGLRVRATFRKLREEGKSGVIHYGYKFAPLDEQHRSRAARGSRDEAPELSRSSPGRARA